MPAEAARGTHLIIALVLAVTACHRNNTLRTLARDAGNIPPDLQPTPDLFADQATGSAVEDDGVALPDTPPEARPPACWGRLTYGGLFPLAPAAEYLESMAVGDLNGDGRTDVVTAAVSEDISHFHVRNCVRPNIIEVFMATLRHSSLLGTARHPHGTMRCAFGRVWMLQPYCDVPKWLG